MFAAIADNVLCSTDLLAYMRGMVMRPSLQGLPASRLRRGSCSSAARIQPKEASVTPYRHHPGEHPSQP